MSYVYADYEIVRDEKRCIGCKACVKQCGNGVHSVINTDKGEFIIADETKCVACHRCVCFCPTRALKVVKTDLSFKNGANFKETEIREIFKQAATGGVLLSSMGCAEDYPVYFDKILINASQVTNPPIDPLREPMETKVSLGKRSGEIVRENGRIKTDLYPMLDLEMPIMFSAMSYGSISKNAHECLARAAEKLGILYNTGEGGLHKDFYKYGKNTIVQVASGRFGVHKEYLNAGAAIEKKMGQGAKPGIGGHLPGAKITADAVS